MDVTQHVVSTPQHVSIQLRKECCILSPGVAEASHINGGEWYVNRVIIRPNFRKQGFGKQIVTKLLEEVTKQGCTKLVLTPGGYDIPYTQQRDFYLKCGFRIVDKKNHVMEYP